MKSSRSHTFPVAIAVFQLFLWLLFSDTASAQTSNPNCADVIHEDYAYLQLLAENGNAVAQYRLSQHYDKHYVGEEQAAVPDPEKKLKWLRKSAENGYIKAQFELGFYLEQHPNDYTEASTWLRSAADYGDHVAQAHLAEMYEKGHGLRQDFKEAYFWSLVSSDNGHLGWTVVTKRLASYLDAQQVEQQQKRAAAWKPVKSRIDDTIPLFNVDGLICGYPSWHCHMADTCDDDIGIVCPDKNYYFAHKSTKDVFAKCSIWNTAGCTLPNEWTCGWPKNAPTRKDSESFWNVITQ